MEDVECKFNGWEMLDLDLPIAEQAIVYCRKMNLDMEEFIVEALQEKLERMSEEEKHKLAAWMKEFDLDWRSRYNRSGSLSE